MIVCNYVAALFHRNAHPSLFSLAYAEHFTFSQVQTSELGFCLSTFKAALALMTENRLLNRNRCACVCVIYKLLLRVTYTNWAVWRCSRRHASVNVPVGASH